MPSKSVCTKEAPSTETLRWIWLDSEQSSCFRRSTVTTSFICGQSQSKFHRMCNDTAETVLWLFSILFQFVGPHCAFCYTCSKFILNDSLSWNIVGGFLSTAPFFVTKRLFPMATRPVGRAVFQDIWRFRTCPCQTEVTTSCILGSNDWGSLIWKLSLFYLCLVPEKRILKSRSFYVGFMFCFWYEKTKIMIRFNATPDWGIYPKLGCPKERKKNNKKLVRKRWLLCTYPSCKRLVLPFTYIQLKRVVLLYLSKCTDSTPLLKWKWESSGCENIGKRIGKR